MAVGAEFTAAAARANVSAVADFGWDCRRQAASIASSTGESTGPIGASESAPDKGTKPTADNFDETTDTDFGVRTVAGSGGAIATAGAFVADAAGGVPRSTVGSLAGAVGRCDTRSRVCAVLDGALVAFGPIPGLVVGAELDGLGFFGAVTAGLESDFFAEWESSVSASAVSGVVDVWAPPDAPTFVSPLDADEAP